MSKTEPFASFAKVLEKHKGVPEGRTVLSVRKELTERYFWLFQGIENYDAALKHQDNTLELKVATFNANRENNLGTLTIKLKTGGAAQQYILDLRYDKIRVVQGQHLMSGNSRQGTYAADDDDVFLIALGNQILSDLGVINHI
ncbi:hypothetical protein [Methylobacterium sp. Leaf106]|uniref:hypothetical protein n=1 Tax=Methylobacterium sp. Leaf106 TaxID=1736255 RepID=UPI0012E71EF5|nr:hypothetical protein [Methylobacterium sp. Leaf106]